MKHLEIERKFLLKAMPTVEPDKIVQIEQWYWKNTNGIWERARTWFCNGEERWIHTIKTTVSKGVNLEDEKDITREEFQEFTRVCLLPDSESRRISKERHIYNVVNSDLKWEVDRFDSGYHLIVAEIEIPKKNFVVEVPDFIGELILLEVTGLKQFSNRNLSLRLNNF